MGGGFPKGQGLGRQDDFGRKGKGKDVTRLGHLQVNPISDLLLG